MTWLEKMDTVLQCMYDHSGENPTMAMYEAWLKDVPIDKGEIQDILLYLWREQMIYCEYEGNRNSLWIEGYNVHYLIGCKGKLFLEGVGGFESQNRRDTRRANLQSWQTWAIAGGTVLAGLYGLIEVVKYIVQLCSSS